MNEKRANFYTGIPVEDTQDAGVVPRLLMRCHRDTLLVASYDTQGCGRRILPPTHKGDDVIYHCPIFIRLKVNNDASNSETVKVTFRLNTEATRATFRRVAGHFSWNSLVTEAVDNYMKNFSSTLNRLYCECFHIETKTLIKKTFK